MQDSWRSAHGHAAGDESVHIMPVAPPVAHPSDNRSLCCLAERSQPDGVCLAASGPPLLRVTTLHHLIADVGWSTEERLYILGNGLHFIPLTNINDCSKQRECEITAIEVIGIGLVVTSIYRPPSGNFEIFLEIIENILNLVSKHSNVTLSRYFNIHSNYSNRQRSRIVDLFDFFNFMQTIFGPTRGLNCLDNISINFSHTDFKATCYDPMLSDHLCQSIEFHLPCEEVSTKINKKWRPITKNGKQIFYNMVETINWDFVDDNSRSVEEKFNHLISLLNSIYGTAFPEKDI